MTGRSSPRLSLDPETTALVNVHWQRDIVTRDGAFGPFFANEVETRNVVKHAAQVLAVARDHGAMVVHARAAFRPGYPELIRNCALYEQVAASQCLQEGTPGAEIIPELTARADEPVVTHGRISAFQGTELDLMLRARGITHVLVTGVATNVTVEGTARDAVGLGYRTILVADACSAADHAAHEATLATFQLLGSTADSDELAPAFKRD
ncbi:MAG TPA: isochorismatase family cysteine hydrolase [Amycolatopsis sp.]|uniref:cysteine hydrolase family protein n=1 Tax=Amycolatopsis sp. TaxID=37632 RepID=UPI002B47DB67|nr:isochorismatase family cysteine hydrolase [Amycolatopsis sp.]HKS47508.1 isochorismatase family cysteine hydrolase [Amycolatopsis sp.]